MESIPDLKNLLDSFQNKKILIVGDVMVDEYLWGEVNRISPEAPVPVVSCIKREHRMGGAANVAINVKAMGAEPVICSLIGKDEAGGIFKDLLAKRAMSSKGIIEADDRSTTIKTRILGNHQQLLRVDQEHTHLISSAEEKQLLERVEKLLSDHSIDALIFQDYDKGVITPGLINGVTRLTKQANIPSLVDPKKRNFLAYSHVSLFKPNFKELIEGMNLSIRKSDHTEIFEAARKLHESNSIDTVMITLSEKGVFISDGKMFEVLPAEERDITDVSGAGDTVIAVAALCLASATSVFQAARLANQAGGLVCEKVGVVPITPEMFLGDK